MFNYGSVNVIFSFIFGTFHDDVYESVQYISLLLTITTTPLSLSQPLVDDIAEKVHYFSKMNGRTLPNALRVKTPKQREIVSQVWLPNFHHHAPNRLLEVSDGVRTCLVCQMFHREESRRHKIESSFETGFSNIHCLAAGFCAFPDLG